MADIAQWVEQRTENLRLTGSNLLFKIRLMCRKGNSRYSSVSRAHDSKSSCYRFKSSMKIRLMCRRGNDRYSLVSRADDSKSSCYRFKSAIENMSDVSERK